jgi:TonB family protein
METLPYLLKVNICWVVFYGCYWLLFRRHTFFTLNRIYLLFSLAISFVIPSIELKQTVKLVERTTAVVTSSDSVTIGAETAYANSAEYLLLIFYCAGVAIMLIMLSKAVFDIYKIIRAGISVPMEDYQLVISQGRHIRSGSFSFLKWMVISNEDYEQNFEPIFTHEMVHVRQWHTMDILFIELLKAIFWFNPALWLYKRALQDTHEFLADEGVSDRDYYAHFLLSYAKSAIATSVANQFFNASLLKKRIHMIYQDRTATWLRSKYLLLLPVLGLAIALMAARKYVYQETNTHPQKAETPNLLSRKGHATDESRRPVGNAAATLSGSFEKSSQPPVVAKNNKPTNERSLAPEAHTTPIRIDRWPWLPGRTKFIFYTLKYPKQALVDGVEGQVSVSFLIDTDGNVSDPKIEKGVREDLDKEAVRVVGLMPRWTPAQKNNQPIAVRYTMNIIFNIAVDGLPLSVREKTPGFWGNRSIYAPAKTGPLGMKHLKELFEGTTVDLRDSVPPTTTLPWYRIAILHPLPEKQVDMRIKLPKK